MPGDAFWELPEEELERHIEQLLRKAELDDKFRELKAMADALLKEQDEEN